MAMLSRLARPTASLSKNSKRFGGFSYFMARHPKQLHHLQFPKEAGAFLAGLGTALALGYGFSAVFGNAEGPYHYDPEQFTPEEWETKSFALDRFLFKYVFPATSVSHWQTVACYKFQDEIMNKQRLIMDVRRISSQIGAMGTWQGAMSPQKNAGAFSQRLFGKKLSKSATMDTTERTTYVSTASTSSDTTERSEVPIHVHVNILSEKNLSKLYKDLKKGIYSSLKSLKFSFNTVPNKDVSKMKHLSDVFAALASLPNLVEIEFCNATLFLPSVIKLLKKKEASLHTLKFQHCKLILTSKSKKESAQAVLDKLWDGIQLQSKLEVLELVACSCDQYQTVSSSLKASSQQDEDPFSFQMPIFLKEHKLPNLRRLVLDGCILDGSQQASFVTLLTHNESLEELEIQPVFETTTNRRQQYQANKRAVRQFLVDTIPTTLASTNNNKLRKLVVSIEDYHLDSVYGHAMAHWVDLVEQDNKTLVDLRATPRPLSTATTKEADNLFGLETDAWLHCNLRYCLRLNELAAQKGQEIDINKKDFLQEILPEAYDVSCLHQLLQPMNPDVMDASSQSVPCLDFDGTAQQPQPDVSPFEALLPNSCH